MVDVNLGGTADLTLMIVALAGFVPLLFPIRAVIPHPTTLPTRMIFSGHTFLTFGVAFY
jgi:hypothetical protein